MFTLSLGEFRDAKETFSRLSEYESGLPTKARNIVTESLDATENCIQFAELFAESTNRISQSDGRDNAVTRFNEEYYNYMKSDRDIPSNREFIESLMSK